MNKSAKLVLIAALTASGMGTGAAWAAEGSSWGYHGDTGPEHWSDISAEYELCRSGLMQSPIDLAQDNARGEVNVNTKYKPGSLNILNNGHTVQVNVAEGSTLTSGTMQFTLLQIHFHTPSEEAVNGQRYPMDAHFVHSDANGNLAVLGILFEEGAENQELAKVVAAAPTDKADAVTYADISFDPNELLPESLDVYRFQGSLTTPPCSEGVNWHVAKQPVTASKAQLDAIHAIIGDNARPLQPANGRLIIAPEG